jgi:hypothetical protein
LIDSPRLRSAWLEGFGSPKRRTEALTALGIERDTAVAMAAAPAAHDSELVDALEESDDTVSSILFDVGAANFAEDVALGMLEENPLAASRTLRSLDIREGSFLDHSLRRLEEEGASIRRHKGQARVALGIVASLITGGIFAGVGATAWAAGVTSGMVSASTSVLSDVPDLIGTALTVKHARLAKGQGLATERTLRTAVQQQQDQVRRTVFNAMTSFTGSGAASYQNAYLKGLQSRYVSSQAAEVVAGVAVGEAAKAAAGARID